MLGRDVATLKRRTRVAKIIRQHARGLDPRLGRTRRQPQPVLQKLLRGPVAAGPATISAVKRSGPGQHRRIDTV
jgi:hypothetical protein